MKFKLHILFFLISSSLFAQKVTTSIDTTKNKIGAEFRLTLKTEVDTLTKVVFPKLSYIGNLEVIQSYAIDTIKKDDRYELIKKYGLTQFDSGKYFIPKVKILINGKPFYSDSLKVEVNDVKVDTLKQKMFDIKGIVKADESSNWWMYLLAIVTILAIGFLGFRLFKKHNKNKKKVKPEAIVFESPIEKATSLLQQLESKELWQNGDIKAYYSELTNIARTYIEEEIHIPALESTTSELIISLKAVVKNKKLDLSKETLDNLEQVLMQADLVKFAKVKPAQIEIQEDKKRISNTIVTIHKAIPTIVETKDDLQEWNEQQKELARIKKLKTQKRNTIIVVISSVFAILVISILGVIYFKGFDYVKDKVIGNPTKELFEGQWINSTYGNPGIVISTPKVLKRMDASKAVPKGKIAVSKELQLFSSGTLKDDFYVSISTLKYKTKTQVDFNKELENIIQGLEFQGASTILIKSQDFESQNGISGIKAYGTLTVYDASKNRQKMYYEAILFSQDGGLQQITIAHKDQDSFGKQIAQRILNSIELMNADN